MNKLINLFHLKAFLLICAFSCGISLSGIAQNGANSSTFGQTPSSSSSFVTDVTNGPYGNSGSTQHTLPPGVTDYGDANGAIAPIGSGFLIILGLSFLYLSYSVLSNLKKEEK